MSFYSCIWFLQPFKVNYIFLSLIVMWVIRFMRGATESFLAAITAPTLNYKVCLKCKPSRPAVTILQMLLLSKTGVVEGKKKIMS